MFWFVCQTNVREEDRARYYLGQKGFGVYLPMMEIQRTVGSKTTLLQKPLFPNYLFVRFESQKEIPFVRWTRGVRKLLPESIRPVPVEDYVVESLRRLEHGDGMIRKKTLQKNDRIRVLRGPFRELSGLFETWTSDKARVRVLLNFVNYQAKVELHRSWVEKVA